MKKRMIIMLTIVGVIFGGIFAWKMINGLLMMKYMASMKSPPVTVSTAIVKKQSWTSTLNAVGSLRATLGVDVTTELAGMVNKILFKPGADVEKGNVLVLLNADSEINFLNALKAQTELAKVTYQRDKAQYAIKAVSKQTLDTSAWNLKNLQSLTAQQEAIVEKKTIKAPFSGRLGISNVNPGQFLNAGDKITTLQSLNPIYIDFYLPQQALAKIKVGQAVTISTDTYPKETFKGVITTIDPLVDSSTRNVQVEATLENQSLKLIPGMFANITVIVNETKTYLTLPQSAIMFNPYGEIVFVVKKSKDDVKQKVASQVFITTGDTRGNLIQVLTGLKDGEEVVSSGQIKLKNNSPVVINNSVQPSQNPTNQVTEDA